MVCLKTSWKGRLSTNIACQLKISFFLARRIQYAGKIITSPNKNIIAGLYRNLFSAIQCILVKSKQIVSITHLIIKEDTNSFVK